MNGLHKFNEEDQRAVLKIILTSKKEGVANDINGYAKAPLV